MTSTDQAAQDIDPDGDPLQVIAIALPGAGGSAGSIGAPFAGQFGDISIDADGNYRYVLDNSNTAVQRLHDGETLSDSFVYTLSLIHISEPTRPY